VLEIDLSADAPEASSLLNRAMPIQSYFDLEAMGGSEGRLG
jgi:hypothetical protein